MKLTNKLNLPQPFVDAVARDEYSPGDADASITELIGPPRIAQLRRQFDAQMEEDASSRVYALLGKACHHILQQSSDLDAWQEKRLYMSIEGWRISGQMDYCHLASGILTDYKLTSVWKFVAGPSVPLEWEQQLNSYAALLRAADHAPTSLRSLVILRDWSMRDAARRPDYPQAPVLYLPVPMWPAEEATDYLRRRVVAHQQARAGDLPLCTDEERWAKPTKWAVKKVGRQSAVKLFDSETEAKSWLYSQNDQKQLFVEERPGEYTRCESYCPAAPFCTQHQQKQAF